MKIWLIKNDEYLPFETDFKKMRTSMLADKLIEHGHEVLWWTSAFHHMKKTWRFQKDTEIRINENYKIIAIKGIGYKRNISLRRFIEHRIISYKFGKMAKKQDSPDAIVACSPPYDLAYKAVQFGKRRNIPVFVDIRDEWPDVFLQKVPKFLRGLAKIMLHHEYYLFKTALRNADGVFSMMNSMLRWGLSHAKREISPNDGVFYLGCKPNEQNKIESAKLRFLNNLEDKFIVTFTGTFVFNNCPGIIIDCAKRMQNENVHFVLAGDGELVNELKRNSENLNNVTFTGWLADPEVMTLLKHSHVGISATPIIRNAFGNKIFAYFASELPIITTIDGELRKLIETENIGVYFPPNDLNALIESVSMLVNNRNLYNEMKENVRKIFTEKFNAENIYEAFTSHIEKFVENKHKQR